MKKSKIIATQLVKEQPVWLITYKDLTTEQVSKNKLWKLLRQSIVANNFMGGNNKNSFIGPNTSRTKLSSANSLTDLQLLSDHVVSTIQALIIPKEIDIYLQEENSNKL